MEYSNFAVFEWREIIFDNVWFSTAKLLKIGQIHKGKPHRLLGEAGGRRLPGSVVAVEGDAGDVFGAVGEAVEGDAQRGGSCGGEDV